MEKCNNSHRVELLEVLRDKAAENCFLYGDIENFSLDSDFMDVWRIVKNGETTSILLRYYRFYVIYSNNDEDLIPISQIIKSNNNALGVSCLNETLNKLNDILKFPKVKHMYLAELNKHSYVDSNPEEVPQKAIEEDIDDLFSFQSNIDEFELTEDSRESFGQEIVNGTGRIYYIKENNSIISTAALTAENSLNGMIIGVATDKKHRRKGLAKSCVGTLCKEMVSEDKSILLFYDNPDAGKLYKELGFVDINRWSMGTFK